jgi:TonB family protein
MNRKSLATMLAGCVAVLPLATMCGELQSKVYTYQVELDANGALLSATPLRNRDDPTTRQLQDELGNWVFQPAERDGRPLRTSTWVRVTAIPDADGAAPKVLSATAGPAPDALRKPDFPAAAQVRGHNGVVVLELQMDARGRIETAAVRDTVGNVNRAMAEAALAAARNWTFHPERVAGVALASKLLMPVCFAGSAEQDCDWTGPESRVYGRDTVLALDPAARLTNPVAYAGK